PSAEPPGIRCDGPTNRQWRGSYFGRLLFAASIEVFELDPHVAVDHLICKLVEITGRGIFLARTGFTLAVAVERAVMAGTMKRTAHRGNRTAGMRARAVEYL